MPDDDVQQPPPRDDASFALPEATQNFAINFGHGTCMMSIAVGFGYGVAKRASVVVARPPRWRREGSPVRGDHYLMMLQAVIEDRRARRTTGPAVALMATHFGRFRGGGAPTFRDPIDRSRDVATAAHLLTSLPDET